VRRCLIHFLELTLSQLDGEDEEKEKAKASAETVGKVAFRLHFLNAFLQEINSDLDDESDDDGTEENTDHIILCQYEKVYLISNLRLPTTIVP
jgi:hypothetical protein